MITGDGKIWMCKVDGVASVIAFVHIAIGFVLKTVWVRLSVRI